MTKPNNTERDLLDLILVNGSLISGNLFVSSGLLDVGTGAGSTNLYLSLYTAGLSESPASGQDTSECTIGTYARLAISRTTNNWDSLGGGLFANGNVTNFTWTAAGPTNAPQVITHWALGVTNEGPGPVIYSGPLADSDAQPFVVDASVSATLLQSIAHGHASNNQVVLIALPNVTFPSGGGIVSNLLLYARDVSNDGLSVSLTSGGAALSVGSGAGLIAGMTAQTISENNTPRFTSNTLRITED